MQKQQQANAFVWTKVSFDSLTLSLWRDKKENCCHNIESHSHVYNHQELLCIDESPLYQENGWNNAWYYCYSFLSIIKAINFKLCSYLVLSKYNSLLKLLRICFCWVGWVILCITYPDTQGRHHYILFYGWLDDFIFTFISSINEIRKKLPRFFTIHIQLKNGQFLYWSEKKTNQIYSFYKMSQ